MTPATNTLKRQIRSSSKGRVKEGCWRVRKNPRKSERQIQTDFGPAGLQPIYSRACQAPPPPLPPPLPSPLPPPLPPPTLPD